MKMLMVLALLSMSGAYAQNFPAFQVSKVNRVSLDGRKISLDPTEQDRFLAVCAVDLTQFKSEKKALKASETVGGLMLERDPEVQGNFYLRSYYNLFALGPGFVFFNQLFGSDGIQVVPSWVTYGIKKPYAIMMNRQHFSIEAANMTIIADENGKTTVQMKRGDWVPASNHYRYFCTWDKAREVHLLVE